MDLDGTRILFLLCGLRHGVVMRIAKAELETWPGGPFENGRECIYIYIHWFLLLLSFFNRNTVRDTREKSESGYEKTEELIEREGCASCGYSS